MVVRALTHQVEFFKVIIYLISFLMILDIADNFRIIFLAENIEKMIFYLVLQLFLIPLYLILVKWVFKIRTSFFLVEPAKRKSMFRKKFVIFSIIGFVLILHYLLFYHIYFKLILDSIFGVYSILSVVYEVSLRIGVFLFAIGGLIIFTMKLKTRTEDSEN
jgi:hypothetical protein